MSQQTTEEPGIIKSKSSGSSVFHKTLFLWMLCHPVFIVCYSLFCRNAYLLCMYGGVRRRGSVLLACAIFFAGYLFLYIHRCHRIYMEKDREPDLENVWFYGFYKNVLYVFDKKRRYFEKHLSKEECDFIRLKYKKIPRCRYCFWKIPACIFLLAVTLITGLGIYKSAQNYNGKLSWLLYEGKTTEYITLENDNLYTNGIQGIFKDIEKKMQLPKHLTLNGVFNLHFAPDGTIIRFDMMLKGYDQDYKFVDTYLISYPSSRGKRIRVQKGNYAQGQEYDAEKSMDALMVGGMVLPYEEAVRDWSEDEYGIYYLGSRTWGIWDENIFSLNIDGSVSPIEWRNASEVTGYSISVFCPDNEALTAKRYMVGYELNAPEEFLAEYETDEGINDLPKEDSDLLQKINMYRIPEQSFDIALEDWGEVTFVSCKPAFDVDFEDASYYLVKDNKVLYEFPYRFENNSSSGHIGMFDSVGAVAFRDVNDDQKKDIIIITYYVTGAGPTGLVPRPGVTIYLAGEKEFHPAYDMMAEVEENILEEDMTIQTICDFWRCKN